MGAAWNGLQIDKGVRALSERGPTALKGSKGPRQIYAQGFTEWVQVYRAEEQEGKSLCEVDIKSKAT